MRHTLTILRLRFLRSWWLMLLVTAAGMGVALVFQWQDLFGINGSELGAYDSGLAFWTRNPKRAKDVVVVAIDEVTFRILAKQDPKNLHRYQEYGAWPFQRTLWARVFTELRDQGARAIVLDATMSESATDPTADRNLAQAISSRKLPVYLGFDTAPEVDGLPAVTAVNVWPGSAEAASKGRKPPKVQAVAAHPHAKKPQLRAVPALAPAKDADKAKPDAAEESFEEDPPATAPDGANSQAVTKARSTHAAQALAFPLRGVGLAVPLLGDESALDVSGKQVRRSVVPIPPISDLWDACAGFGLVRPEEDDDGKMRTTRFGYSDGKNAYANLSLAVVADLLHAREVTISPGVLQVGTHPVRINKDGTARIHFGGNLRDRFTTVPLVQVIYDWEARQRQQPAKLKDVFKDKVVLIGGFATGTADVKANPFERAVPGVVKHAAEIDNLLENSFIVDAPFWVSVLLSFGIAYLSVLVIMLVKAPLLELTFPLALFFFFYLVPGWFLVHSHVHVLSTLPSTAGSVASVLATVCNHVFAGHDRDRYRETFSRYMESALVDQLVEGKALPPLDGVTQSTTAFFSDIRGFSTFSESYRDDPKTLMRILNRYLTCVTEVLVKRERATIDKYVGDSVIALFNAPVPQPDHALRGCRAALAVQEALVHLREEFRAEGLPDVYTRIGLNTGMMTVGNLGSEQLIDYTAIGDEMNLASRLEGANKAYGTLIMMGPGTYEIVREDVDARELDWIRVAGKTQAVAVYELLGMKDTLSAAKRRAVLVYGEALAHFRAARFGEALQSLTQALVSDPEDGPSLALQERCELFLKVPPTDFDGVADVHK